MRPHYREHGYTIVERFLNDDELEGALDEWRELLPGWVEHCQDASAPKPDDWQRSGRPLHLRSFRFPFPGSHLNAITLHPELVSFAKLMAGGSEMFCEQSHLTFKSKGNPNDREQAMHCDYGNHTLAYPPDDPAYWQTAYLLYYTDVTENHAPTAVCSRQHYPEKIPGARALHPGAAAIDLRKRGQGGGAGRLAVHLQHANLPSRYGFPGRRRTPRAIHHLRAGRVEVARHRGLVCRSEQAPRTEAGSNRQRLPNGSYWASRRRDTRIGPRKPWPASAPAIPEWT